MTAKLKQALAIVGAIVAVVLVSIILYANNQRIKYQQAIGASKALTAEYNDYVKSAELAIKELHAGIAESLKQEQAAIDAAEKAKAAQSSIQAKYDTLKEETAALPPDALSGAINIRIGADQSRPTANGLFSFSRVGTERTLNLFLDGEGYSAKYEQERAVSSNLRAALDAAERGAALWSEKYSLQDGEYQRALAAWGADKDALKHLRRSIFGRKIKSFLTGAAFGAVAVIVYSAATKEP
jgi:hypothetical protein